MLVGRNGLGGELTSNPIGLFGKDDTIACPRRGNRGGTPTRAPTDDNHISAQLFCTAFRCQDRRLQGERQQSGGSQKGAASHNVPHGFGVSRALLRYGCFLVPVKIMIKNPVRTAASYQVPACRAISPRKNLTPKGTACMASMFGQPS